MKKINIFLILISSLFLLGGCNSLTNNSEEKINESKKSTESNNSKLNSYNLDEIYNKIKYGNFSDAKLVDDLDYDKINKTLIIVGEQSFGKRETLSDEEGNSSQRFLNFFMDNGTQITVILGELSIGENIEKNMITDYTDDYKNVRSEKEREVHLDSSVFSINNIIINVVCINIENELDTIRVIKFKEEFVKFINSITS